LVANRDHCRRGPWCQRFDHEGQLTESLPSMFRSSNVK
jgi:hypothetical protein